MRPRVRLGTIYVTAVPRRRPCTIPDGLSDALASASCNPFSLFSGADVLALDPTAAGADNTFNMCEDEVEELECGEETEVDDNPACRLGHACDRTDTEGTMSY